MKDRLHALWKHASVDPGDYVGRDDARNQDAAKARFVATAKRYLGRLPLARETVAMYFCMLDGKTPVWVKAAAGAALAYFVLPFDAIPDFLPVIGLSDDASVLAAALTAVSTHVKPEHRDQAAHWMAHEHLLNPQPDAPTPV